MSTWNIVLKFNIDGVSCKTSRYYISPGATGTPDATMLEELGAHLAGAYATHASLACELESLYARNIAPGSIGFDFIPDGWPVNGSRTGEFLAPFIVAKGVIQSPVLSYPYRGYVAISGLLEGDVVGKSLNSGGVTNALGLVAPWLQTLHDIATDDWLPALYSRAHSNTKVAVTYTVKSKITSQRSRLS